MTFTAPAAEPQPRVKGDAIYFYCTSRTDPDEGVERGENPANDNDPLYVHRPIFFQMVSKTKDIYIDFAFFNYNPAAINLFFLINPFFYSVPYNPAFFARSRADKITLSMS